MNGTPVLDAHLTDDGTLWWVLCPWCGVRHHHAMPVGIAVCHCSRHGGPYETTGYIGVLDGETAAWEAEHEDGEEGTAA